MFFASALYARGAIMAVHGTTYHYIEEVQGSPNMSTILFFEYSVSECGYRNATLLL